MASFQPDHNQDRARQQRENKTSSEEPGYEVAFALNRIEAEIENSRKGKSSTLETTVNLIEAIHLIANTVNNPLDEKQVPHQSLLEGCQQVTGWIRSLTPPSKAFELTYLYVLGDQIALTSSTSIYRQQTRELRQEAREQLRSFKDHLSERYSVKRGGASLPLYLGLAAQMAEYGFDAAENISAHTERTNEAVEKALLNNLRMRVQRLSELYYMAQHLPSEQAKIVCEDTLKVLVKAANLAHKYGDDFERFDVCRDAVRALVPRISELSGEELAKWRDQALTAIEKASKSDNARYGLEILELVEPVLQAETKYKELIGYQHQINRLGIYLSSNLIRQGVSVAKNCNRLQGYISEYLKIELDSQQTKDSLVAGLKQALFGYKVAAGHYADRHKDKSTVVCLNRLSVLYRKLHSICISSDVNDNINLAFEALNIARAYHQSDLNSSKSKSIEWWRYARKCFEQAANSPLSDAEQKQLDLMRLRARLAKEALVIEHTESYTAIRREIDTAARELKSRIDNEKRQNGGVEAKINRSAHEALLVLLYARSAELTRDIEDVSSALPKLERALTIAKRYKVKDSGTLSQLYALAEEVYSDIGNSEKEAYYRRLGDQL